MTKLKKEMKRFLSKIRKSKNCWIWKCYKNKHGYGVFRLSTVRKQVFAHRYSYTLNYGEFDKKLFVCHRCDNPSCVRPDHLFLGTALDNNRDSLLKGRKAIHNFCKRNIIKTHCPRGHEYNNENTIVRTRVRNGKLGKTRECKICCRKQNRISYHKHIIKRREYDKKRYRLNGRR